MQLANNTQCRTILFYCCTFDGFCVAGAVDGVLYVFQCAYDVCVIVVHSHRLIVCFIHTNPRPTPSIQKPYRCQPANRWLIKVCMHSQSTGHANAYLAFYQLQRRCHHVRRGHGHACNATKTMIWSFSFLFIIEGIFFGFIQHSTI